MILELFGGCGGASLGIRNAFPDRLHVGIEIDKTACLTRRAAGLLTIRADVEQYPTEPFEGKVWGLWASPPCPDFSQAGKRKGILGNSGHLIFQVPRWVKALRPEWVACEQVVPVLDYWKTFAEQFRELGYHTWAGVLVASDYGVPQERYRAILMASLKGPVTPPKRTHAEHPIPDLFGDTPKPWVSMAEGLGWGMTKRPANTVMSSKVGENPLDGGSGSRKLIERERERERESLATEERGDGE